MTSDLKNEKGKKRSHCHFLYIILGILHFFMSLCEKQNTVTVINRLVLVIAEKKKHAYCLESAWYITTEVFPFITVQMSS